MNNNRVEIISLIYDASPYRGFSTCCSEVRHDRNRANAHGRIGYYLNGGYLDNPDMRDLFFDYLSTTPIARSISIDSRFLSNPDVVSILANSPNLEEIRITDEGYTLTEEVLNLFPESMLIVCDEVSSDISLIDRSRVYTQHGLFKKETNYIEDDFVSGYFITRELSDEELDQLVDIVNNDDSADYSQISFRVYNPAIYKDLVTRLRDRGLREDVRLNFLGYPLTDGVEAFDGLDSITKNPITITYDTCSDMVNFYTQEPYSVSNHHHSELEGGGTTSFDSYFAMVTMLEQQERHIKESGYSPLEAAIYAYRYLQQNYAYDPKDDETDAINVLTNRQLDLVATSRTMVCEGYATLYSALLRRCGIPMFRYSTEEHVRNIGRIVDPKYGVDRIAVFDPTWDHSTLLDDGSFVENNRFEYFMFSPRESVFFDPYVTIPSSLVIDYAGTGVELLQFFSKDPYEYDLSLGYSADGYAITMLDRMGIQTPEPYTVESYRTLIENLNSTSIFNMVDPNSFVSAYQEVLRREHPEYSDYDVSVAVLDAINSMQDRLHSYSGTVPTVRINYDPAGITNYDIPVLMYPMANIMEIANFNKPDETVSHEEVREGITVNPQVLYGPRPTDIVVEEANTEEHVSVTDPQILYRPQVLYGSRPVGDEVTSVDLHGSIDEVMNEIELDEFIPGTRIRKPRVRDPYEKDEEYVAYLAEYYGRYFPQAQQDTVENTTYSLTRDQIIQDLPVYSNAPSRYNGIMTDVQIEESRNKLR